MKFIFILLLTLFLIGCTDGQVEEFAFRNILEHDLIELCSKDDKKCISAVKAQIKDCMVKSNWRRYLDNEDSEEELNRFTSVFYACIVDSEGNPYFETDS